MAVRQGTRVRTNEGLVTHTWTGLAGGDTGTASLTAGEGAGPIDLQVIGTIGTSVLAMDGSMDGTNWSSLSFLPTPWVAATISRVTQKARFIRPNIGAGTGASLIVIATEYPGKV